MQDKLEKLFNEIGIDEEIRAYFFNASIDKVVIYDKNKLLDFVIVTDKVLPIDVYDNLLDKLVTYFKEIKKINLYINPVNIDYDIVLDYYNDIMKKISMDKNKYNIFLDRDINTHDNVISVPVFNKVEYANMVSIKDRVIDKLRCYGFNIDIDIDLVLDGDNELKDKIESEKEATVNIKTVNTVKKEENTKPVFRSKKSKEITPIKDVIYEVENINIKGCIFGIDYFESKNGYKIITLKVTDYTDSINKSGSYQDQCISKSGTNSVCGSNYACSGKEDACRNDSSVFCKITSGPHYNPDTGVYYYCGSYEEFTGYKSCSFLYFKYPVCFLNSIVTYGV